MSDSDSNDFDRMATSKYASQADLSDDDTVFSKKPQKQRPPTPDDDLAALEAELSVDPAKLKQLQDDLAKYELLRKRAVEKKLDAARIAKVDKKIAELKTEITNCIPANTFAQDREIQKLERDIEALEAERAAIDSKLEAKLGRLRQLRPTTSEWLNDPSQLGGRVVDGKFVADEEGEDDYEQMAKMIAERRRRAQADGQYNSSNHVKVIRRGPAPQSDNNPGF